MSGRKSIFEENKNQLIELYNQDLTNRQIAKVLNVHHTSITTWLRKLNLQNKFCNQSIDIVGETEARCSKCHAIKPLIEFQYGRKNSDREYRFSYCNKCRKDQCYLNLNSQIEKYLKNNYNKLKRRANSNNIPFEIQFSDILDLYKIQEGKCFYCDIPMTWGVGKGLTTSCITVDKIIPEKGYIKGNIVLCTLKFNTIKSNLTIDEIQKYMPLFYNKILECKWIQL